MSADPICVMATGACTAVGLSAAAAAASVRAGLAMFSEHARFADRLNEPVICAGPIADPDNDIVERCVAYAKVALADAVSGLPQLARQRLAQSRLMVTLPEARPGIPEDFAALFAARLREELPSSPEPIVATLGHAGGGIALASVRDGFRTGRADLAIVLGVDSYLSSESISWLDRNNQLHATYNAWGFVPGEGAGVTVLSTLAAAREVGVKPAAVVEGIGIDAETVPITDKAGVCLGWGLTNAIRAAVAPLRSDETIDRFYCDQNGQTYRADEIGFMLARLGTRFKQPDGFVAPADCWGDVGSATIPLLIALAVQASLRSYAPGPLSLIFAGSDSGRRAAILLRAPDRKRQAW